MAQNPTPQQEDNTDDYLAEHLLQPFEPILTAKTYSLNPSAADPHWQLKTDHVHKVDQAIEKGGTQKSKGTDLLTQVAIALIKVNYVICHAQWRNNKQSTRNENRRNLQQPLLYVPTSPSTETQKKNTAVPQECP